MIDVKQIPPRMLRQLCRTPPPPQRVADAEL